MAKLARAPAAVRRDGAAPTLTAREIQVLEGMSHGRSTRDNGRELFLSEDTVKTHARRLFKKLGRTVPMRSPWDSAGGWSADARPGPPPSAVRRTG
ncbi:hypothetical protein SBADM41S_11171 [Streptomyces badius]